MNDLKNKIVLVTGGSGSIGRAIAKEFLKRESKVIVIDKTKTEEEKNIDYIYLDLLDYEKISESVKNIIQKYGRIDVLVNNAGIVKDSLMLRMSEDDFDTVITTNLKTVFMLSQLVAKQMLKQKSGSIINISSLVGLHGNIGQSNYAASKAGLIGLTKTMAKELAYKQIRVNCIAPGYVQTSMLDKVSEEYLEKVKQNIPLNRFGEPVELANVVLFLASNMSSYITGEVISVGGGLMM